MCRYGSLECVKVLTSRGASVTHRDEDGMSVLEHAEQNDRRQVVGLIKRAQLANQMRQRRKAKNQGQEQEMSVEEFRRREVAAAQRAEALLQEVQLETQCKQEKVAKKKAKKAVKNAKKKDVRFFDPAPAPSVADSCVVAHEPFNRACGP